MEKKKHEDLETSAVSRIGHAYLKVPRRLLYWLLKGKQKERQLAILYLSLYTECAYADKQIAYGEKVFFQPKGVWIGTQEELAQMSLMNIRQVRYNLDKLKQEELIEVERFPRGLRIRVYGYNSLNNEKKKETPRERAQREYDEMVAKLKAGRCL